MNFVYIAHVLSESIKRNVILELPSTIKVLMGGYSLDYIFKLEVDPLTIQYKFRFKKKKKKNQHSYSTVLAC